MEITDKLILQTQQGEKAATEILAGKIRKFMFEYVNIHLYGDSEAEDVCQEASTKAIMGIKKFKVGTNLYAWLSKIAMNCIADFLRKKYGGTHWPLKKYRAWILDFIYLIDQQLRDFIAENLPESERQSFYDRITEELITKTFRQFNRLKYKASPENTVLSAVKELLRKYAGIEVIPFSKSTNGEEDVGIEYIRDTRVEIDPEKRALREEFVAKVNACIEALSSNEKIVIRMHYYAGLKVKEIAQLLGRTPNAVSQMLKRAVTKLGRMMEEDDYFLSIFSLL